MFEIDLLRGVVIGITKGHRNNILKVYDYLDFFVDVHDPKFLIRHGLVAKSCSSWLLLLQIVRDHNLGGFGFLKQQV